MREELQRAIDALERVDDYVGIRYINGVEDLYISPFLRDCISTVLAALREKLERSKGCPVCDGKYTDEKVSDRYCNCCGKRLEVEP